MKQLKEKKSKSGLSTINHSITSTRLPKYLKNISFTGRGVGRPSEYSPDVLDEIELIGREWLLEYLQCPIRSLDKTKIMLGLGRTRDTFYRWLKEYPEFEKAVASAIEIAKSMHIDTMLEIASGIRSGNVAAAVFIGKAVYGMKEDPNAAQNVNNGTVNNIYIEAAKEASIMSTEDLQKYLTKAGIKTIEHDA